MQQHATAHERRAWLWTASILALAMAAGAPAAAQSADAEPSAQEIGEVVVTARKREERLQDVPLPVSAFNEGALEAKAAADLTALSTSIPNVELNTVGLFPNANNFSMRGVGQSGVESQQDPRVALYVNGAYQPRVASGPGDMFDVESVEVLRGPQGALYGRNAFGGAIALRTKRPDSVFGVEAEATVANYGRRDVQAAVDLPIVQDVLDTRIAFMRREWDGFFRVGNPTPGRSVEEQSALVGRDLSPWIGDRNGGAKKDMGRVTISWRPTSNIEATGIVTYVRETSDSAPQINQRMDGAYLFNTLGFPGRDPFGDSRLGIAGDGSNPFISGSRPDAFTRQEDWDFNGELSVDTLGGVWYTIVNYHENENVIYSDTDGELVDLFNSTRMETFNSFQVESRFSRTFGAVDLLAGVFYIRDEFDLVQRISLGFGHPGDASRSPPVPPTPTYQFPSDGRSPNNVTGHHGQVRKSISPFAQINWNVTDQLRVNAALRYSREERNAFNFPRQTIDGPPGSPLLTRDMDELLRIAVFPISCGRKSTVSKKWSPGLSVDYKVQPDVMVFALWQRAYKSGGINVNSGCLGYNDPYEDERVDNFEVGVKSQFFDRRLLLNANVFWSEYTNLQQNVIRVDPNSAAVAETYTDNSAAARIWGVEAEISFRPVEPLTLYSSIGYLNSKYKDFCANLEGIVTYTGAAPTSPCGSVIIVREPTASAPGQAQVELDYSGLNLTFAPKWDVQVGATYRWELADQGSLTADVNVSHTSRLDTSPTNSPRTLRDPRTMVDASLTWRDADARYRVILWGRNLNDDVERLSATPVGGLMTFAQPTEPRTYGVTIAAEF